MKVFIQYGKNGEVESVVVPETGLEGEYANVNEEGEASLTEVDLPDVTPEMSDHQLSQVVLKIMNEFEFNEQTKELVKRTDPETPPQ